MARNNFEDRLLNLKEIELIIRKECTLNSQDLENLATENLEELKSFENDLNKQFNKNIDKNHAMTKDFNQIELNTFEPRLVLTNKLNKTNKGLYKKILDEYDIKKEIDNLKKDLNILKTKFDCEKAKASEIFNLIASNLDDNCSIVYSN